MKLSPSYRLLGQGLKSPEKSPEMAESFGPVLDEGLSSCRKDVELAVAVLILGSEKLRYFPSAA